MTRTIVAANPARVFVGVCVDCGAETEVRHFTDNGVPVVLASPCCQRACGVTR